MKKRLLGILLCLMLLPTAVLAAQAAKKMIPAEISDVKESDYYYDAVIWAVNHDPQITNGTGGDHFSPGDTCTRAQVVTFLWRAKGCPEPQTKENPFNDVSESTYYYKAVLWANENDITNGTGGGGFSPNAPCTRAQVVTFLWRAAGKPTPSGENTFADVPSGQYYTDAVVWAVNHTPQITNGTGGSNFSPNAACTRGQIVTFLYRDMGASAGDGGVTDNSDPNAPKTIESTQIISFDCWFSTMDAAEPGALGNHIYELQAKLENGAVKGTYQVRDTGEERSFRASHDFLNEIQGLVEMYALAQYNGHSITVAGLPGEYGARLDVQYASRESIYAYDNQDNFLSWGAMSELLKLFERGAAAKITQPLSLAVETKYESEPLTDGYGEMRYPIYRLDAAGYDSLSAALAKLNEMRLDGASGEMDYFRSAGRGQLYYRTDAFVTRSDSEVVSFYERTARYESADWEKPMTEYEAHNLDTRTGKELKFSDVFRDMEYLPHLLLMEFEKAYPDQTFYDEALDFIRQSVESDDGNISFALGYGCVHIFANEYVLYDAPGGQHITLSYVLNPDQVRAFYTTAPSRWIVQVDDGTTYWRTDTSNCFRIKSSIGTDTEDMIWEVMLDEKDDSAYVEPFYGYAPECWLACMNERYFIYLRVPVGDVSMLTKIYEVTQRAVTKRTYDTVDLAMRSDTPLNPDGVQMFLDKPIFTTSVTMLPYGTFRIETNGLPEQTGDVCGLDGPWVLLRKSGRYNAADPADAAVSGGMWTLVAGERMRPYQTDMASWLDFITEDGRVVRFTIDRFADDMRLDNFGTLNDVFMPDSP